MRVKEIVWHCLYRAGVGRHLMRWLTRKRSASHLASATLEGRFSLIYQSAIWTNGDPSAPKSGTGSSVTATATIRRTLPALLDALSVESLLDLGCGDWTWMGSVPLKQRYIGADIVRTVIAENTTRYGTERVTFVQLDATQEPLPPTDAVLCREVLFHLSFTDGWAIIKNVRASGARYFIATTDPIRFNADIVSGDFRELNLRAWPFSFGPPIVKL